MSFSFYSRVLRQKSSWCIVMHSSISGQHKVFLPSCVYSAYFPWLKKMFDRNPWTHPGGTQPHRDGRMTLSRFLSLWFFAATCLLYSLTLQASQKRAQNRPFFTLHAFQLENFKCNPMVFLASTDAFFIAQSMSMTSWQSGNAAMHGSHAKFPHWDADFLMHNASRVKSEPFFLWKLLTSLAPAAQSCWQHSKIWADMLLNPCWT